MSTKIVLKIYSYILPFIRDCPCCWSRQTYHVARSWIHERITPQRASVIKTIYICSILDIPAINYFILKLLMVMMNEKLIRHGSQMRPFPQCLWTVSGSGYTEMRNLQVSYKYISYQLAQSCFYSGNDKACHDHEGLADDCRYSLQLIINNCAYRFYCLVFIHCMQLLKYGPKKPNCLIYYLVTQKR